MKKMIIFCSLILASVSHAIVTFQENSPLPVEVQRAVNHVLNKTCLGLASRSVDLMEDSTTLRTQRTNNGLVDVFYKTTFLVYSTRSGKDIPLSEVVTVESAWLAGANPSVISHIEVGSIRGSVAGCK